MLFIFLDFLCPQGKIRQNYVLITKFHFFLSFFVFHLKYIFQTLAQGLKMATDSENEGPMECFLNGQEKNTKRTFFVMRLRPHFKVCKKYMDFFQCAYVSVYMYFFLHHFMAKLYLDCLSDELVKIID